MRIEIDQSGKIKKTNKITVLAYSNAESRSILITAKDKKNIQATYRRIGQPKIFYYKLFAVLIFVLIRHKVKSIDQIIIDREYPGYEKMIIGFIHEITEKHKVRIDKDTIHFKSIGKKSKAHGISNNAYKTRKPDLRLTARDFYRIAFQ